MNIKELRKKRNITQTELSKLTGLSQQHISLIEKNQISPNCATLEKIAKVLGYKLVWVELEDSNDRKT